MKQMHWYVAYSIVDEQDEILFTGGEFTEVETREEAIEVVMNKVGWYGIVKIREVEHLENPYKKAKKL